MAYNDKVLQIAASADVDDTHPQIVVRVLTSSLTLPSNYLSTISFLCQLPQLAQKLILGVAVFKSSPKHDSLVDPKSF